MITGTKQIISTACVSLIFAAVHPGRATAVPIFVDATATLGSNDGTTWANAYLDLQDAINQAWGAPATYPEIRVAQGRYTPDSGTLDQSAVFHLINGVQIKGGYGGLRAANHDECNILRYETILSGDLFGDDIPCDLYSQRGDNSRCVVLAQEPDNTTFVDLSALLEGFTITSGNVGFTLGKGAGIYIPSSGASRSSPTIKSCKIAFNRANDSGGGLYCDINCAPEVRLCTIEGNEAKFASGMFLLTGASPTIDNCHFVSN